MDSNLKTFLIAVGAVLVVDYLWRPKGSQLTVINSANKG